MSAATDVNRKLDAVEDQDAVSMPWKYYPIIHIKTQSPVV
jgi:hypothetical protein